MAYFSVIPILITSIQVESPLMEWNLSCRLSNLRWCKSGHRLLLLWVWTHHSVDGSFRFGLDILLKVLILGPNNLVLEWCTWILWNSAYSHLSLEHWVCINLSFLLQEELFYFLRLLLRVWCVNNSTGRIGDFIFVIIQISLSYFISPMNDFVRIYFSWMIWRCNWNTTWWHLHLLLILKVRIYHHLLLHHRIYHHWLLHHWLLHHWLLTHHHLLLSHHLLWIHHLLLLIQNWNIFQINSVYWFVS